VHEKYDGGMVCLGDESPLNIVGCGIVLIRFLIGTIKGILEKLDTLYNVVDVLKNEIGELR